MRTEAGRRAHFTQPFGPVPVHKPHPMGSFDTNIKTNPFRLQPFQPVNLNLLHDPEMMDRAVLDGERANGQVK